MPRLSYPENQAYWSDPPDASSGSPENKSHDLCRYCWPKYVTPEGNLRELFRTYLDLNIPPEVPQHVIDIGVEHPNYDDCDYDCLVCESLLTERDN